MSSSLSEVQEACMLARRAGAHAVALREGGLNVSTKAEGELVTHADHEASAIVVEGLAKAFPDDIIISEEMAIDDRRLTERRCWYVDPIDGTKDFAAGGIGFSVMIGLTIEHKPTLGAVYWPSKDCLFYGVVGEGAWQESPEGKRQLKPSRTNAMDSARFVASKSHRTSAIDRVKGALGLKNEHNIGSVGLKVALIAANERDIYVNPLPRCKVWDTCAPEAILQAAGGSMSDLYGTPLRYDSETLTRPRGIIASNGPLHEQAVEKLSKLFASVGSGQAS